ncbi:hypothetical protein EXE58_03580 [Nocardioides seonyuensis]|uniref:Nucleotidyltransferase family protein n=1 Tax=Nocardioides seonyuensis TaxID=2518371 RepID=A0A4P7IC30_9ACTN|nr:nucleotidyltransferase family protein [Nocardioides seonyuensis]QBX54639.1 hypothetical protein EXE58_03580 [Nocardioides seonyuensis]
MPEVERLVSRVLVAACRGGEVDAPLRSSDAPELIAAARFHRIAPLVLAALRHRGDEGLQPLQQDRLRAITAHLRACAALDELAALLDGVDWVTFKGPVFSQTVHPVPGLRTYNDVDVLVAPAALREVCRRLHAAGWRVADFEDMLLDEEPPGEMHWVAPGGVLVDLHWSMINMHSRRRLFDVSTSALLERRVRVAPGVGQQWWTLDPVDALLHACLHAALAGANKLVYLVDVDGLSRAVTDWDEAAARARQWGAQSQVSLVMGRARRVLGTPVPADLDSKLGVPLPVRALMSLTNRTAPVPDVRKGTGWSRFIARAVGPTTGATVWAAATHALRGLTERVRTRRGADRERVPADERSLEVFLSAVESRATMVV